MAEKIGRTGDTISQLERGLSLPSSKTLDRLAQGLAVPIRDFFDVDRTEEGSAQRRKLQTEVIDMVRRMTDKELQLAVQILEAITSKKTRSTGKPFKLPLCCPAHRTGSAVHGRLKRNRRKNSKIPAAVPYRELARPERFELPTLRFEA